ncbi:hypothetical protein [Metallosphaera hakonensis]|uniref:Uncharacterized protein n=1 Tax=Metallosphaera hakonensis JCM 8857 = DSM 7519 TaxID=1293036 RepID=A0A2U9ITG5_9CREN|nr:hypothetical protein [Metallosphaera hakonensis]AWR99227.1 hypothetical protein DFR87_05380 [Metallosphaera hakonensis JCM 8857 = DSM 7519]
MGFEIIPGLKAVYRIDGEEMKKVVGEDVKIDLVKLRKFLMENFEIGKEEAEKLDMGDFLGFAMILDDLGIALMGNYVIFVDALKTNWNKVLEAFQEALIQ